MVFPGRLSTGCYVCRRRKVKCDGARPACRRCVTQGRQCTGYPDAFAFREYKATKEPQAGKAAARKRTKKSTDGEQPASGSTSPSAAVSDQDGTDTRLIPTKSPSTPPSPPAAITPCLEWQSLCYFFHQHVLPTEKSPCEGHLAFLPELYQEKGNDPSLRHAILSVSYLSLFNTARVNELYVNARKHYGVALKSLTTSLSNKETSTQDETFAAALFLSMFMDLSGERQGAVNPHIPGICSLMHLRGRPERSSKYARKLFGWAFTQIQIQAVANNQFAYACLPASINMAYNPDYVLRSGIITSMISEFCHGASEFRRTEHNYPPTARARLLHSILGRAYFIMEQISIWDEAVPQHWKRQFAVPGMGQVNHAEQAASRDPWTPCFLAVVQAAQILYLVHVFECWEKYVPFASAINDEHIEYFPVETFSGIDDRIRSLIEVICDTVTYTLGHVTPNHEFQLHPNSKLANGYTLLWPMWVVVNSGLATADQLTLCRLALECVGSTMGYRLASVLCADGRQEEPRSRILEQSSMTRSLTAVQ
ncbi:hypothetical protein ABZX51_011153 [Aspergillus tubingensis]|uniref:Zn(2)-C6 fungal-type domain-containing protein n=1 Tax=Aspergillus tubingensis (strain CBS 134.48) TaxID=767770 RepID=A0A1L9N2T6_ASPTC|nr:putative epoxide hydrolase [Aspergillus tubingensis]OJI83580.1 hypothetical protein ASPTUDRAFT_65824 [Aspergillus tubingensis CBS 134.48]GFN19596.1 putative epoxide hydrolase [Aspergillus tubingensis]GLA96294.1 hypothetical protein AtubIFM57143_003759 [Aspergillus tubingensis]